MDAFFASVEQLTRPTLAGRPVLVGGVGGRGVVAGASYEARVYGARSAMPMHEARRLIGPTAVVVPPRGSVYRVVSGRVFEIVRRFAPVIETLSLDEAFGEPPELAGATVEDAARVATAMRSAIRDETGLAASVGLGSGKQIAKIASGMAKPDGYRAIAPSTELGFLHGLPVRKLWGVGPVSGDRLGRLGVETIGDFAALSQTEVASVLGATVGPALHKLAQGIDKRPVAERADAKQISAESTFATDIIDLAGMRAAVSSAASHAHRRLLDDGRGARTIVVKHRLSDMSILTRSSTLPSATTDLRALTAAAYRVMLDPLDIGPVRLVGVGYSGLDDVRQDSLFPELDAVPGHDSAGSVPDPDDPAGDAAAVATPESVQIPRGPGTPDDFPTGTDVTHPEHGHGWVQGGGHGFVTVRFETRSTGRGRTRNFRLPEPLLERADPLGSLDWDLPDED
ncbi:DNA polymerase IV [Gordonia sp. (in: high G+C Gram-positive bacteria)]|uniref:DNA polymerase IV n=1 Tax=Gordonia sp. (in: high G+C Gram-positive bacteria) TaxID=84139 RepID=UPI003F9C191E